MDALKLGLCVAILLLAGCVGQPIYKYARTGDTITVVLYPTEPDVYLKKENITATLIDVAGTGYPVTIRNVFRLYSDPTSSYFFRSAKGNAWPDPKPVETQLDPYQGQWLAVVELSDPATFEAPTILVGPATLALNSLEIGTVNIAIEVLAGQGQPVDTSFIDSLEPMPQVVVNAQGTPGAPVGGGTFIFRYDPNDFADPALAPQAVTLSPDRNIQLLTQRANQRDGTTLLHVMLLNPHGFTAGDGGTTYLGDGVSLLRDLKFAVVWDKNVTIINNDNWRSRITLESSQYFDLEGNPESGLTPVLTKVR